MRLSHFYFLKKESAGRSYGIDQELEDMESYFDPFVDQSNNTNRDMKQQSHSNPVEVAAT